MSRMPPVDEGFVVRFRPRTETRVEATDHRLSGVPIVFNAWSQDLGGFKERILPEAVDRTLRSGDNVDALLDHRRETNAILGSTDSGLLEMRKQKDGLHVSIRPPDTSYVRDALKVIKAGLARGMSFAFRVMPDGQEWDEKDGLFYRTITDMQFSEVSVVVNPAYLQTEVSARNAVFDRRALDEYKASLGWKPSMAFRERVIRAGIR
jgi:uncharacterized protein